MKMLNTKGQVQRGQFACKVDQANDIKNHWNHSEGGSTDNYVVEEIAIMNDEEYADFRENLLADWDFLDGKGGIDSTTATTYHEENSSMYWDESQLNEFLKGSYRKCIGVTTPNVREMIVIDPQGYNYARYSTIVKG